jgi:hypothetical protein
MPKGPNPFQPGGGHLGNQGQGKEWFNKLGHMHPWIRECMRPFHEKFQGRVMLGRIMSAGNVAWDKLPVLERYVNKEERKNYLCYNHVLGICGHRSCRFQHAMGMEIPNEFATHLCATLRPGMEYILRAEGMAPAPVGSGARGMVGAGVGVGHPGGKQARPAQEGMGRPPKQAKLDG